MSFDLKKDWPIVAAIGAGVVGLFVLNSGNGATQGSSTGGLTGSQYASVLEASNSEAAQLQEAADQETAQIQGAQATLAAQNDQGILQVVNNLVTSSANNSAALSGDRLNAQVAEYEAYLEELGSNSSGLYNLESSASSNSTSLALASILHPAPTFLQQLFPNGLNLQQLSQLLAVTGG